MNDIKDGVNVLSLFDGIGSAAVALERVGIKINKYYGSEIEEDSIKVVKHHYPDAIHLGDITKWKNWDIDFSSIDILFAGFPCQSWSLAGKQKGLNDERGQLIYAMMDILNEVRKYNKDVYFLFENVKMKPEFLKIVNNIIGVKPVRINSKLVSAGLRDRYYWTNIKFNPYIEDKCILLKDIIESGCVDRDKSLCIIKRYEGFRGSQSMLRRRYFGKSMGQVVFENTTPEIQRKKWLEDDRKEWENIGTIRALTTRECERIQTLPEDYVTSVLGDTPKAKGIVGNGWTIDVIAHILSFMNKPYKQTIDDFLGF